MEYPEGATPLDPDEMLGLKFPHITTRKELDQMEHVNIQEGLHWVNKTKHKDILTDQFVRKLHTKLFGKIWQWAGTYRQTEKNIGIDPVQIQQQLKLLLDDIQFWIENNTYPEHEMALRFHHRMVQIHLFPNGNGRHARIMTDVVLTQILSQPPIVWKGDFLNTKSEIRNEYIRALRQADQGDYGRLLTLFSK